jgi:GNAT acetyltransferase-like protein
MPKIVSPAPDIDAPPLAPAAGRFRYEIVEQPGAAWDTLAAGFSDMCMEQSFAFAGSRWSKLRSAGLMLLEDGEPVAMALALIATLPVLGLGLAYVKFGPLWRKAGAPIDPRILFAALEALKQEFGVKRRLLVRIMPPADPGFEPEWKDALQRANFSLHAALSDRERYLVDLTLSEQDQLASLGAQWRANLKKISSELAIEEPDLKTGVPVFMRLYRNMLARKKFDDHHGLEDLPAIAERAGATLGMRLFMATHRGKPVVGSIVIGPGDRVFVPFSATSDEALGLRAGYALRWAIINRLRGTKARWLDLGGAEGDQGLRHYKLGNVGKRGRVLDIPGEYDFAPNALAAGAARAIELGRDLVRAPTLKKLAAFLPI